MELVLGSHQQPPHQVDVGGLVQAGDNHVENYYQKHFFRINSLHSSVRGDNLARSVHFSPRAWSFVGGEIQGPFMHVRGGAKYDTLCQGLRLDMNNYDLLQ